MSAGLVPLPEIRRALELPAFYELDGERVRIGRAQANDIAFRDAPTVSRFHAVFERDAGGDWNIRNLSDSNPVLVNGEQIRSARLRQNDVLHVGDVVLRFRADRSPGDTTLIEKDVGASLVGPVDDSLGGVARYQALLDGLLRFLETACKLQGRSQVYERLQSFLTQELYADQVLFIRQQGNQLVVDQPAGRRPTYSSTVIHRARSNQRAVLWQDTDRDLSHSADGFGITSAICAPVTTSEEATYVYLHRLRAPAFTAQDLDFVCAAARVAAIVEENTRMRLMLTTEVEDLRSQVGDGLDIKVAGTVFENIVHEARRVAKRRVPVLIRGETGTGKDILARLIHAASDRSAGPFVAINCAAIPDSLLESELFGYAPRSGIANSREEGKTGKFELAHQGTLFLDEIGDLPLSLQPKLLRILETSVIEPIGAESGRAIDIRLICATHQNLEAMIEQGSFRRDLFHRVEGFVVEIPPLRERPGEVVPLALHFLERLHARRPADRRPDPMIDPAALELLAEQEWPGNVRELRYCVECAELLAGGAPIELEHLRNVIDRNELLQIRAPIKTLEELENEHIRRVLQMTGGNKKLTAEILGIHRNTLTQKIRRMGEQRSRARPDPSTRSLSRSGEDRA